jgi:hypothetical protein
MIAAIHAHRASGFILVITMLFIMVFSMLISVTLQRLAYTNRLSAQIGFRHQSFYDLESVAQMIQRRLPAIAEHCMIQENDTSTVVPEDLVQNGCGLEQSGVKYHYHIANLGVFPCLMIQQEQAKRSSYHWLIMISSERLKNMILYIRIATPALRAMCPAKSAQTVIHNPLSWYLKAY